MKARAAYSLLELIVVIAILAVMTGLLLPAVQKVRESANRLRAQNQIKQIQIAIHNHSAVHDGRLAALVHGDYYPDCTIAFVNIMPFLEADAGKTYQYKYGELKAPQAFIYRNTDDPSYQAYPNRSGNCSFPLNFAVFGYRPHFNSTFSDGTSNTFCLAEHYARCGTKANRTDFHTHAGPASSYRVHPDLTDNDGDLIALEARHRWPTFASDVDGDEFPYPNRPVPTKTFQVKPKIEDCDPTIPQTPYSNSMLLGMMDGSVRSLARSVTPGAFWAAVTPAGGETLSLD